MPEPYTANDLLNAIAVASKTLSERKDEINRLNVFPVPDGDTGTNMSLTLETVVENLANLPIGAAGAEIRKAITTGALMGARGNSGVITSQILRGLCEGSVGHDELNADSIDAAFAKSQEVAFQAVRKPVEGTILTVLRDSAAAAKHARKKKMGCDEALAYVVEEAYASVQRTPDLLPVLKENGVVDAGEGNAKILKSLGVDVVVSGGQTMNPSTKDLLDAAGQVNADAVIILPNNKNIIMAAQSACELAETPCAVVPTRSVPEAFAALFGFDEGASLEENVESMTEAYADVKTGEVTVAIKDSKDAHDNPIKEGDVIGIADGAIEAVGSTTEDVVMALLGTMEAEDADTLTILAGEDMGDDAFDALIARIEDAYDDLEIDAHRGDQPLYPVVMSVE